MLLPAFLQTSKSTTVVRSHACRVRTQGYYNGLCGLAPPHHEHSRRRRQTAVNSTLCFTHYSSFHHHKFNDRQQIRSLKGPATTRTLLGSFSSLTSAHSGYAPEIEALYHGNKAYITRMSETNPKLLQRLANDGQKPPFMLVECSDSRVNEQALFSVEPGTIFTARNIANQFDEDDPSSNAVLSYAVQTLKVKHVIVMGHYGCGGIAASMIPSSEHKVPTPCSANLAVHNWISPIRQIYQNSNRSEIVIHRTKHKKVSQDQNMPHLHDPAFRALVEENVKANVMKLAKSSVIRKHYASIAQGPTPSNSELIADVYIHGWVYDVENGQVSDLGVSVGPPGKLLPPTPFPTIKPLDPKKEPGI